MLKQIQSSVFRKNPILFHEGLNVVLGDEQGSNSIGKSTLLMIVDFVFAGGSYIEKNKDTVKNLNHHFFEFILEFEEKSYYFRRGTEDYKLVESCDKNFSKVDTWTIKKYKEFLHAMYIPDNDEITFRSGTGIFSRIAQKENFFNYKPLKAVANSKEIDGINELIKLFGSYNKIEHIEKEIKLLGKKIAIINSANRHKYIKKPTCKQYESNKTYIETNLLKLNKMAMKLSFNINDFLDINYQELQNQLHEVKNQKETLNSKLIRVNKNIQNSNHVKNKNFDALKEYFDGINISKLQKIEEFHKGLNNILLEEFYKSKDAIEGQLGEIEQQIHEIEQQIIDINNQDNIPNGLLQPLVELISLIILL